MPMWCRRPIFALPGTILAASPSTSQNREGIEDAQIKLRRQLGDDPTALRLSFPEETLKKNG